jgi:tyrosinase
MSGHFIIAGVPGTWSDAQGPPTRLEITDLVKIDDQFSLFVQALGGFQFSRCRRCLNDVLVESSALMQGTDWKKSVSHYQIGGIHGFPFTPWENSGPSPVNDDGWDGYCTHGSVLFPSWHRPYVALFEVCLLSVAIRS